MKVIAYIFYEPIAKWWFNLENMIEEILYLGKTPVLVALSRKMPRFFEWFKYHFREESKLKFDLSILQNVELTTELALPFIYTSDKWHQKSFIILDDTIIHGTSLRDVSSIIYHLTGEKPRLSCICRSEKAHIGNYVRAIDFLRIPILNQYALNSFCDFVSDKVASHQLPIDMEFPIFRIKNPDSPQNNNDDLYVHLRNNILLDGVYDSYNTDKYGDTFTAEVPKFKTTGVNVDFAKFRFFKRYDEILIESLSPMVLQEQWITDPEGKIFSSNLYRTLWDQTAYPINLYLKDIDSQYSSVSLNIRQGFVRSLCVWANYLLSLSSFVINRQEIIPSDINYSLKLSKDDLSLILGSETCNKVYSSLSDIINAGIPSFSEKIKLSGVPDSFSPNNFRIDLFTWKIKASVISESLDELMREIFNYQHYSNKHFVNASRSYERYFFGESFESLRKIATDSRISGNVTNGINIWIDKNIDNGYIIPKYEGIKSKYGEKIWRRYFHAGIRKFKD